MSIPLRVGDIVHGHVGGWLGRDHYDCSRVEAIGADWVVVRVPDPQGPGSAIAASAEWSRREEMFAALEDARSPYDVVHTSSCPDGSSG